MCLGASPLTLINNWQAVIKHHMKFNYFETIFTKLRRPKLQSKVWIKTYELDKFCKIVIWLTSSSDIRNELVTLITRIKRLVRKSGWNFSFLYLKEVQRLLIRSISGSPEPIYSSGIIVSRDGHGLPRIIPINLRNLCLEFRKNVFQVRAILSLISIYRVFPTSAKVKLNTVTDPFIGTYESLSNLRPAVREVFGRLELKLSSPKLIKLESAGPNAVKSSWGSSLDALAFLNNPLQFAGFASYCWFYKGKAFLFWSLFLMFIGAIPYWILLILGYMHPLKIGRLGVVYDQAGKARIIAICSYFIQLILKPLHNSLFRTLKGLETDGTFDQHKPLDILISKANVNSIFHCFDLSAATDRLPIHIQRDILNILKPGFGDSWSRILDIEWYYNKSFIKYAVGQPMGAYSSWGMLAVTHHVIVRYAALRCGIKGFNLYAVLGDDIVIMHDDVAEEYLQLMHGLGISINLSKSIVSSHFAEFAKVWRGPGIDLTPIGPGLVLRSVRNKPYLGILLGEAVKLNLIESLPKLLTLIQSLSDPLLALWSTLGLGSPKWGNHVDAQAITWGLSSTDNPSLFLYSLDNAIRQLLIEEWNESKIRNKKEYEHFVSHWWYVYASSNWPTRVLESLLKLFGPGFWIYALSFNEVDEYLSGSPPVHTYVLRDLGTIYELARLDPDISISSIDWRDKKQARVYDHKIKRIAFEFDRTLDEMRDYI